MALFKSEAVVIRKMELGEADRLVTLFTGRYGKIRAVAKGARKVMSRFSAATDSLSYCHFVLHKGRKLNTITQCDIRDSFRRIREDLSRFAFAEYVADVADVITEDEDPSAPMFALLLSALKFIDSGLDPETVAVWFLVRALSTAGYKPVLDTCAVCGTAAGAGSGFTGFDPAAGGVVCASCGDQAISIATGTINAIRFLQSGDQNSIRALRCDGRMLKEARLALESYLGYHCGRMPRSSKMLESLSPA
ncbi:MAG: DNA repair protein RecO [Firmicutes bacterium]|nr:DNA repair protein RecO [Bacillota bacterium]